MTAKTIPLSVRVSDEDAEFLAALELPAANTPSEKLRSLITAARARADAAHDAGAALAVARDLLTPAAERLRRAETAAGRHSELVAAVYAALPEILALAAVGPAAEDKRRDAALHEFEARLMQRLVRLLEGVLRLGVTQKAPCYDPDLIARHLGGSLELLQLIQALKSQGATS